MLIATTLRTDNRVCGSVVGSKISKLLCSLTLHGRQEVEVPQVPQPRVPLGPRLQDEYWLLTVFQ